MTASVVGGGDVETPEVDLVSPVDGGCWPVSPQCQRSASQLRQ